MSKHPQIAGPAVKQAASAVDFDWINPVSQPVIAKEPNLWQIVVVGAIDPRQHHPLWYRSIDCISEEEAKVAEQSTVIVAPPQPIIGVAALSFIQFDVGKFAVICVPDRWTIQTITESNSPAILDVSSQVFTKLNELPVSAFGINRIMFVSLKRTSAKKFLADKFAGANLALPVGNSEAQLTYTNHLDDSDTQINISAASFDEKTLRIVYNRNHPSPKGPGHFDLGKLLRIHVESDWEAAEKYSADLSACVEREEV